MGARTALTEDFGWRRWNGPNGAVWFAGYVVESGRTFQGGAAAQHLSTWLSGDIDGIARALRRFDGHFAIVLEQAGRVVAATDRIRSIPLFYARDAGGFVVDSQARRLLASIVAPSTDRDAGLAVAMSGYTVGRSMPYR